MSERSVQPQAWEPRAKLLAAAHAAGFKLSDPQLGRLHRAGLLPNPRTHALGRGKGTASEFPPASTERLLRILEIQKQQRTHKLGTIAWHLWWLDGGRLTPPARGLLRDVAARWDRDRNELGDLLAREEAGEPDAEREVEAIYLAAENDPVQGLLGTIRRNAGREGFSSVARVLAEVATGRFESYRDHEQPAADGTPQPDSTGALLERALGLDHARRDRIAGREPRFAGSSEAQLMLLSELIGASELTPLAASIPEEKLDQARGEIRNLLVLISTFAPMVERTLGGDASGYRTIARALTVRTPRLQAFVMLAWLALRRDQALHEGLGGLVARLPQALAARQLEQLSRELAGEVPALQPALRGAARASLRGEEEQRESWRAEIKRVSEEHREQVDAFFALHPEVTHLIATAQSADGA
jgi:hypothetical protein